jgi:hypothetical protein
LLVIRVPADIGGDNQDRLMVIPAEPYFLPVKNREVSDKAGSANMSLPSVSSD